MARRVRCADHSRGSGFNRNAAATAPLIRLCECGPVMHSGQPLNQCLHCGYLIATDPGRHRCPECGMEYESPARVFRRRPPVFAIVFCTGMLTAWFIIARGTGGPAAGIHTVAVMFVILFGVFLYHVYQVPFKVALSESGITIMQWRGRSTFIAWAEIPCRQYSVTARAVPLMAFEVRRDGRRVRVELPFNDSAEFCEAYYAAFHRKRPDAAADLRTVDV
jgi:hypothetical protein